MAHRTAPQNEPLIRCEKRPCRKELLFGALSGLFSAEQELELFLDRLERVT